MGTRGTDNESWRLVAGQHGTILFNLFAKVCPSEIEYFKIGVHNPYDYHEDLIELNPMMSSFFELRDV